MYNISVTRAIERVRQLYMKPMVAREVDNYYEQLNITLVEKQLNQLGFNVKPYEIDWQGFEKFQTMYKGDFGRWEADKFIEKRLEYYISENLLDFMPDDITMDVGSWFSPYPDLMKQKYGCRVYAQDLAYPAGIHDWKIGGNAANLPLEDNSISKIALHCTFEHFEGDADSGFIEEVSRILKPGGRMVIVPLYIHQDYMNWTDPSIFASKSIPVDKGARLYKNVGWNNQFGRHYNPAALFSRILKHADGLNVSILKVNNIDDLDPRCYVRFIGLFEKGIH